MKKKKKTMTLALLSYHYNHKQFLLTTDTNKVCDTPRTYNQLHFVKRKTTIQNICFHIWLTSQFKQTLE